MIGLYDHHEINVDLYNFCVMKSDDIHRSCRSSSDRIVSDGVEDVMADEMGKMGFTHPWIPVNDVPSILSRMMLTMHCGPYNTMDAIHAL